MVHEAVTTDLAIASSAGQPIRNVLRLLLGGVVAVVVTFALYWLMAELVAAGREAMTEAPAGKIVDFVRVKRDQNLEVERPKPEKPDKPQEAPDAPPPPVQVEAPTAGAVHIGQMRVDSSLTSAGFRLSASDGEYLPIVKVAPVYPARAQSRGIEGWVLLQFTVTETGSVKDPVVLEAEPPGIFEEAAKRAVLKFKYKPRVENGRPIEVPGVQHLITFEIEQGRGR
ncbi:energy transducer TonB [Sinimarinibacterium thermocellulolyticum]|uniref:Protein TonB n=1 Tax=Sinimarinibacterium thermocellulolyticum TaxID=3170016 RepID=A0ABV2ADV3_9GAMM